MIVFCGKILPFSSETYVELPRARMKPTLLFKLIFLFNLSQALGLECEEPLNRDYCVIKGQIAKELPPGQVPLEVNAYIGVLVKDFIFS